MSTATRNWVTTRDRIRMRAVFQYLNRYKRRRRRRLVGEPRRSDNLRLQSARHQSERGAAADIVRTPVVKRGNQMKCDARESSWPDTSVGWVMRVVERTVGHGHNVTQGSCSNVLHVCWIINLRWTCNHFRSLMNGARTFYIDRKLSAEGTEIDWVILFMLCNLLIVHNLKK